MKLAVLTAAAALTLASGTAAAETYLGLGIGKDAPIDGTLGSSFSTDDSSHGRIVLGKRFGRLAVEASLFGTELNGSNSGLSLVGGSIDLKYHLALSGGLEGYVKGGLHDAALMSEDDNSMPAFEGTGHQYGAGLQYRFDLALTSAALWLDYNRTQYDLTTDDPRLGELSGTAKMLTLGLSLGF